MSETKRILVHFCSNMPRYYFDLHNDVDAVDREGEELVGILEARKIAIKAAREIIAASAEEGHINLNHFIQVREESGEIVDRITFGEAIFIVPQRQS